MSLLFWLVPILDRTDATNIKDSLP